MLVGYGATPPPAVVPPPTISCRLRSENAYCDPEGRGFESRHLQGWSGACVTIVGGVPTPRGTQLTRRDTESASRSCIKLPALAGLVWVMILMFLRGETVTGASACGAVSVVSRGFRHTLRDLYVVSLQSQALAQQVSKADSFSEPSRRWQKYVRIRHRRIWTQRSGSATPSPADGQRHGPSDGDKRRQSP